MSLLFASKLRASHRKLRARRHRLRFQALESRRVLAAAVSSEIFAGDTANPSAHLIEPHQEPSPISHWVVSEHLCYDPTSFEATGFSTRSIGGDLTAASDGAVSAEDLTLGGASTEGVILSPSAENLPTVLLSASASLISEANGQTVLTATLSNPVVDDVTVGLAYGGDASYGIDYRRGVETTELVSEIVVSETLTLDGSNPRLVQETMPRSGTAVLDFRADDLASTGYLLGHFAPGNRIYLYVSSGNLFARLGDAGPVLVASGVDDGQWHQVALVYGETSAVGESRVYLDGVQKAVLTSPAAGFFTADEFYIGAVSNAAGTGTQFEFVGDIRDVRVYGGPLNGYNETGEIVIPAGSFTADLVLTGVPDFLAESSESIVVEIDTVTNAVESGEQQAVVEVTNAAAPPTVSLSNDRTTLTESGGTATFSATLSSAATTDTVINVRRGGDATFRQDYVISDSSGAATPDFVIEEETSYDGTTATEVPYQLASSGLVSLQFRTNGLSSPGYLLGHFNNGNRIYLGVNPNGDLFGRLGDGPNTVVASNVDDGEWHTVAIAYGTEAEIGTAAVYFDDVISVELETPNETLVTAPQFLIGAVPLAIGIGSQLRFVGDIRQVEVFDDLPETYNAGDRQIVIPAGQTTAEFTVMPLDDSLDENDESLSFWIASTEGAIAPTASRVELLILDDDEAPEVSLAIDQNQIAEMGDSAVVTVSLSEVSAKDIEVDLGFTGIAQREADFETRADPTIAINLVYVPDGQSIPFSGAGTGGAAPTNMVGAGDLESIMQAAADAWAPLLVTSRELTIYYAWQPRGTQALASALTRSGGPPQSSAIRFSSDVSWFADGTPEDHSEFSNFVDINRDLGGGTMNTGRQYNSASGLAAGRFDLFSVAMHEIGHSLGWTQGINTFTNPIIVGDSLPFSGTTIPTGTATGGHFASNFQPEALMDPFTDRNTRTLISDLDLLGLAELTGDGVDLSGGTSIRIPAGETSGSIRLTAIDDVVNEIDEEIVISVDTVTNANGAAPVFVTTTIIDDDAGPPNVQLSVDTLQIAEESGQSTITATLTAPATEPVTLQLGFSGEAVVDIDFTASASEIVIPVGQVTGTVVITATPDDSAEDDESLVVDITSVVGAIEAEAQQVSIAILDDDNPPEVSLSIDRSDLVEGGSAATVQATLSGPAGVDVDLRLTLSGTATQSADYSVVESGDPAAPVVSVPEEQTFDGSNFDLVEETLPSSGTIVLDFNANDLASTGYLLGHFNGGNRIYLFINSNGDLLARLGSGGSQVVATGVDDGQWHQVALVYGTEAEVGDARVYLDGVLASTITNPAASLVTASDFYLGAVTTASGNSTQFRFVGQIRDFQAYDHVLTEFGGDILLTIPAGQLSATVTLAPLVDAMVEPTERVFVDLVSATTVTIGSPQQVFADISDPSDAPEISAVVVNDGADSRSQVTHIDVVIDREVDHGLLSNAFEIRNRGTDAILDSLQVGTPVDLDGQTSVRLTFGEGVSVDAREGAGELGNSLSDGNYVLTVKSEGVRSAGTNMEQDFRFGESASDAFFRLLGDTDGDRDVDGQDYGRFGLTFLASQADAHFNSQLDSDGDGDVDGQDYGRFGLRFLQSLPF